uniref:Uncharacterized protein LOC111108411 n=1 Tax=Crassostrea virginica TaxID=6565 RepID=A0A8B8B985_CRAVI|nr:uncharacterized protein LOC111108411 [Crassostrea virginica]
MDKLLEVIKCGVQHKMEIKKSELDDSNSQGKQKEKRQEALLQARVQQINKEFLGRYTNRDADKLMEDIRKLEEFNESKRKASLDGETRRRIIEYVLVDLVRKIRNRRNPQVAKKIMLMLIEHHDRRQTLQQELLAQYDRKNTRLVMEAIRKLEESSEIRRKANQDKENRRRLLQNVFFDLASRTMRPRENLPVAKVMLKLTEHHRKRQKLQEELMLKVGEREMRLSGKRILHKELMMYFVQKELKEIKGRLLHMEIMRKLREKQQRDLVKRQLMEELLVKFRERQLQQQIRKYGYQEIMHVQLDKPESNDDFLPRKLFMFGIDTIYCQPLPATCYSTTHLYEEIDNYRKEETNQQSLCAKKPKATSLKKRVRRLFGMK